MGKATIARIGAFKLTLLLLVMLAACTRAPQHQVARITIAFPHGNSSKTESSAKTSDSVSAQSVVSTWGLSAPTNVSDIGCYAVSVEASDLSPLGTCVDEGGTTLTSPAIFVGLVPVADTLTMMVPQGTARKIHVYALSAASSAACKSVALGEALEKANLSAPLIVGSATADIVPGDNDVSIQASLSSAPVVKNCGWTGDYTPPAPTLTLGAPSTLLISSATTVTFPVTISGATNIALDSTYVSLMGAGSSGCSVDVTGTGLTTRAVTLSGCSGEGTVQVRIATGAATNSIGTASAATDWSTAVTVTNTVPTLSVSEPSQTQLNSSGSASYNVTYTGATSVTLAVADITLSPTASASCSVAVSGTGTSSRTVTLSSCTGDGTVGFTIASGSASNFAGTAPSAGPVTAVAVDNSAPTISIGAGSPNFGRVTDNFSWLVSYTGATAITLTASDITLSGAGTTGCTAAVSGSGTSYRTVTVSGCSGSGSMSFSIAAGTATDSFGNLAPSAGPAASLTVDNVAPSAVLSTAAPAMVTGAFSVSLTFSESVSGFTLSTLSLTNAVASNLSGSGSSYTFDVTPSAPGAVSVSVNSGAANDAAGNVSSASNTLSKSYDPSFEVEFASIDNVENELNSTHATSIGVTLSVAKPNPVQVFYSIASAFTTSVAHSLASGFITIPAGQTSGTISFNYTGDATAGPGRSLQVALTQTDDVYGKIGAKQVHRKLFVDDDAGSDRQFIALSTAKDHTCGIGYPAGKAYCWGANANGQLGDGTVVAKASPTAVSGALIFTQISTGPFHTCGINDGGVAYCWGLNSFGQLGDGTTIQRTVPTLVGGGHAWARISVGTHFTCAIDTAQTTYCWGNGANGRLGNGSTSDVTSPTAVSGALAWDRISTGVAHACGVTTSGDLYCWGDNSNGQLGDSTLAQKTVPTLIANGFIEVAAGQYHSCGITSSNDAKCWGENGNGQLGDGTQTARTTPTAVSGGTNFMNIAVGPYFSCGLKTDSTLYCWGNNNDWQFGDYTGSQTTTPAAIFAASTFTAITLGEKHACALGGGGLTRCWGYNEFGQLGQNGPAGIVRTPAMVASALTYSSITTGGSHSCGIESGSNKLHCWGSNQYGRLGIGGLINARSAPGQVESDSYSRVAAGQSHTCGITSTSVLKCWGNNASGQLGDGTGTPQAKPEVIDSGTSYIEIAAGGHTCGITMSGALKCWGYNGSGQLGDGTTSTRYFPTIIDSGTSYARVAVGMNNTCAITTAGVLKCWGYGPWGATGTGTTTQNTPVVVDSGTTYSKVSVGANHACGITTAGVLKCWGENGSGQIGNATNTQQNLPVVIDSGVTYSIVSAGDNHTCAVTTSNSLKCWGDNMWGMLGNNVVANANAPQIIGSGIVHVAGGGSHSCSINSAGGLRCWGMDRMGQLGLGSLLNSPIVVAP